MASRAAAERQRTPGWRVDVVALPRKVYFRSSVGDTLVFPGEGSLPPSSRSVELNFVGLQDRHVTQACPMQTFLAPSGQADWSRDGREHKLDQAEPMGPVLGSYWLCGGRGIIFALGTMSFQWLLTYFFHLNNLIEV